MTVRQTLSSLRSVLRRIWGHTLGRIALILSLIAVGFYGCVALSFPQASVRYRMTIEVEADGMVHTGSGVIEATYRLDPNWLPSSRHVSSGARGEAVTVDLGSRGLLFALDRGQPGGRGFPPDLVVGAFGLMNGTGGMTRNDLRKIARLTGRLVLEPKYLPFLVRFLDPSDPRTIEQVDPSNLAATFGPGVALKPVTIEITTDPITRGIEKYLPWMAGPQLGRLDGSTGKQSTLASQLSSYDFKRK